MSAPAPKPVVRHWTAVGIVLGTALALAFDFAAPALGHWGWFIGAPIAFAFSLACLPILVVISQFDLILAIQDARAAALILETAVVVSLTLWITFFSLIFGARTRTTFRVAVIALVLLALATIASCHDENVQRRSHVNTES
jgi:hypothetical protein